MKTIGLLGGMSWESTVTYYQMINTVVKEKLGGLHSAKCLLYSVDFHELEERLTTGDWNGIEEILSKAALNLEKAGADFIVICTNTMHKVADRIADKISVPLLHIADVTGDELIAQKIEKAALLGTKYTMELDFYKSMLRDKGIEVMIPDEEDRIRINDIIFHELCLGVINDESKKTFLEIIEALSEKGAEGIILGCTEIGMIVSQQDTAVPLFDTTEIHGRKAAEFSIKED